MVCVLIQGSGKTMSTLTEKTGCKSSQHVEDEHRCGTPSFFIALLTVILGPDMQFFFKKLHPCLTFLLSVNQMHVVVSSGAVFPKEQYFD